MSHQADLHINFLSRVAPHGSTQTAYLTQAFSKFPLDRDQAFDMKLRGPLGECEDRDECSILQDRVRPHKHAIITFVYVPPPTIVLSLTRHNANMPS